jgi:cell wall-associated NlpC family hydrolase
MLASVSLFGGAVTASGVSGTAGRGTVTGLEVEGSEVSLGLGQVAAVANWGQVTVGRKVGRARALLVLTLLAPHSRLPAGTVIAVGFEAAPQPLFRPQQTHAQADGKTPPTVNHSGQTPSASQAQAQRTRRRQQPSKPPPDFPTSPSPLLVDGGLTEAATDSAIVSIAAQYLGIPYQWGGASPKTGFDCSGLVKYVFAQLGVPLPHFAASQWYSPEGVWVPPNRLQPGDLVFFVGSDGTRKEPGHVGIYVGDGYLIDAPHTGSFVRIDSLTEPKLADQYVGATKIVATSDDARHLLGTPIAREATQGLPSVASSMSVGPLATWPAIVAAADPAIVRTAQRGYWLWVGVALGGLLFIVLTGTLVIRRRQPLDANPKTLSGPH